MMILKPGKPREEGTSYRPISLLPIVSKLFEKLLLTSLNTILEEKHIVPDNQFGFRGQHATIEHVHRVADKLENILKPKYNVQRDFSKYRRPLIQYGTKDY
jgi:hypothetical protein